ncbi:MAG: DNA replication/repair protein RecF [Succinivibrionaceae bacterium]|jgi:DNA replication and repair protein RecF|nr:DNA replication/repair protein RecF [Succinivibrionaceae bacterium]MCI6199726.1 DNA replication/repair protein RecF [Pseudomonadota bacterium]MDD6545914.1 DNA replication/repair protein RecF [Pseudomonadota bacterium]MDY3144684.1 DNA replication/repair protein RecF [Succinivibrionaceae bacterium]MDY6274452.1 DNA replication/repair protein RecF [Succinivibrionaceae bacterium]
MTIELLRLTDFRNFRDAEIRPGPGVNLITGPNGSGKTSLIEAVGFLSNGRSFRTPLVQRVVSYGCESLTVYAELCSGDDRKRIGISRGKSRDTEIRINGESVRRLAELSRELPLQILNPESMSLLGDGGPELRRSFIDWGCFFSDESFFGNWARFRNVLKQRNAALRTAGSYQSVAYWDRELVRYSEAVSEVRERYCSAIRDDLMRYLSEFLPDFTFSIDYYRGWERDADLAGLLERSFPRDREAGYTMSGAQRADLRIKADGIPARDILSRGQLKLAVCAMKLSQGLHLEQSSGRPCTFLIDDFASELDAARRRLLSEKLSGVRGQIFVTAVDDSAEEFSGIAGGALKRFQIRDGIITETGETGSRTFGVLSNGATDGSAAVTSR